MKAGARIRIQRRRGGEPIGQLRLAGLQRIARHDSAFGRPAFRQDEVLLVRRSIGHQSPGGFVLAAAAQRTRRLEHQFRVVAGRFGKRCDQRFHARAGAAGFDLEPHIRDTLRGGIDAPQLAICADGILARQQPVEPRLLFRRTEQVAMRGDDLVLVEGREIIVDPPFADQGGAFVALAGRHQGLAEPDHSGARMRRAIPVPARRRLSDRDPPAWPFPHGSSARRDAASSDVRSGTH